MDHNEITETVLKAIYSKEDLFKNLVLKGGQALRIHEITSRQSQDLDFSIKEEIRFTKEKEGRMLEETLTDTFGNKGYLVNSFNFNDKPKKRKDNLPPSIK